MTLGNLTFVDNKTLISMIKNIKNIKLGFKLNIFLVLVFLIVTLSIGTLLSKILYEHDKHMISEKASLLIETINSVRNYTNTQVTPEFLSRLETESLFLPQAVPSYSAREVFEDLTTNNKYDQFFFKEAALNPTNLRDKANPFETEIIKSFRQSSKLPDRDTSDLQQQGFRTVPGGDLFYIARPITINKESCLRCHSDPQNAPKSQIATYGKDNGFGWNLNEVVGAEIISLPANQVVKQAQKLRWLVIGIVMGFLLVAILLLNLFLKFLITDPINKISHLSKKLSTGDLDVEFEQKSNDEIGILATSLNRLKVSMKIAMEMIQK